MLMNDLPILGTPPAESPVETADAEGTYAFVSLGCPKNLVDSERMLGLLPLDGYELVSEPGGADFVVVNTCGFIESARQESFAAIDEMLELKRRGETRGVIVSGCLAERQGGTLLEELPGDRPPRRRLRPRGGHQGGRPADRRRRTSSGRCSGPAPIRPLDDRARLRITPRHFAFLKISEGCDRLCTFCAIPEDARQARHQADREGHRRGPRAGGRRRPRADHRRPGHDVLRHGPVRRAAAGGAAARAGTGRRASTGFG